MNGGRCSSSPRQRTALFTFTGSYWDPNLSSYWDPNAVCQSWCHRLFKDKGGLKSSSVAPLSTSSPPPPRTAACLLTLCSPSPTPTPEANHGALPLGLGLDAAL